jgi:hypothetical protein
MKIKMKRIGPREAEFSFECSSFDELQSIITKIKAAVDEESWKKAEWVRPR